MCAMMLKLRIRSGFMEVLGSADYRDLPSRRHEAGPDRVQEPSMPELPEVETVVRQLAPLVTGRRLRALEIRDPLLSGARQPGLRGRTIERVYRVGKQALLAIGAGARDPAPLFLAVHLRMTGRLLWSPRPPREAPHLRARLLLDAGGLLFVDPRRFGTLRWHRSPTEAEPDGIDPLSPAFTPAALARLLASCRQDLKAWLLRQDRLAGLGNIYASEILFEAGLSPFRTAGSLEPPEIEALHRTTRRVLRRAIRHCGTTFSDFQGAHGVTGRYQERLRVYGREGRPCPRCGAPVARVVQQQRSTFFCRSCVPGPEPDGARP
jgi:formamidopyrimidine-DNA glycosylase